MVTEKQKANLVMFKKGESRTRECGKKGKKASDETKARKKRLREIAEIMFRLPLRGDGQQVELEEVKSLQEAAAMNMSVAEASVAAVIRRVLAGDIRAAELLYKIVGEI